MASKSFEDVVVWHKAHAFVLAIYRWTDSFPRREIFGLTAQLRRAAVSVPANIAEGFKKRSQPEKARFMNIAQGSLEELKYYAILAADLGYAKQEQVSDAAEEVSRLLEAYSHGIIAHNA